MSPSATPATQMERRCHQAPRLPCKVPRRPGRVTNAATKHATRASPVPQVPQVPRLPDQTQVHVAKCQACHANGTSMSPSARLATQMERRCHQAPCLPRKVPWRSGRLTATKRATSDTSATPATPNAGRCHQVPRLPRKWGVSAAECHARHAKCRGAPGE